MKVIGIVGGIASGKSAVAQALQDLGASVINADLLGHQVLEEPAVRDALHKRWGDGILDPQGNIYRPAVAQRVFGSSEQASNELRFLESVTHPRITARIQDELGRLRREGAPVVVLDAALLLEAGWKKWCDRVVLVEVAREERLRRACSRGWTEQQFAAREATQLSVEEKRKLADEVIDNSGPFDHTLAEIRQFWNSLNPLLPE